MIDIITTVRFTIGHDLPARPSETQSITAQMGIRASLDQIQSRDDLRDTMAALLANLAHAIERDQHPDVIQDLFTSLQAS